MKHYHKNPRQITKKQKDDLFKWMDEFGDLGCIVINVRTDEELIGGNQRSDYPGIMSGLIQPVITQRFEQPTPQGTIMEGYYEIKGERFKVRWVDWDDKKAERANLIANKAGGTFDTDILANQFDLPVLLESGFEERELIGNGLMIPDFQPVGIDEQGRLDQKKPVICPECGHEFTPK